MPQSGWCTPKYIVSCTKCEDDVWPLLFLHHVHENLFQFCIICTVCVPYLSAVSIYNDLMTENS